MDLIKRIILECCDTRDNYKRNELKYKDAAQLPVKTWKEEIELFKCNKKNIIIRSTLLSLLTNTAAEEMCSLT